MKTMGKMEMIDSLSRIVNKLHNAMDEIGEIEDNEFPKHAALHYVVEAEMEIHNLIDEIDMMASLDGTKSGAV